MEPKEIYLSKPWLKYYPEGVPHSVEAPDKTVQELFDGIADKYGKKTALIFYGKKISYNELKDSANRFAAALTDLGVRKGDTVSLYLLNCPQYVIAYFGALKTGAKITPISPVYTTKEVKHQLTDSQAKTVICEDMLYDIVEGTGVELDNVILSNIGDYLPKLKKLFGKTALSKAYQGRNAPSAEKMKQAGLHAFKDLLKRYPPTPPTVEMTHKEDLAALPYTGGTTGLPKAAMLTHYNLVSLQQQVICFWPFMEEGNETVIAFLPFFHIYGQVLLMLGALTQGHTIVLFTAPDLEEILEAVERYQASAFYGVPTLYEYLKEHEKTDRVNWKRLKAIVCGADTLHDSTIQGWERRTGTKILEGYGMTETTAVSHTSPPDRPKPGSFGVPIPNMSAAIIDVDGTEFKPVGEEGELILNGPNIMQGYWRRPESFKEDFVEIDGQPWLRTGDLVRMDEDGYFYFFDRKRDLIKHKGFSVFARHVEEVLYNHPQVKAAGVVGVPDAKVGNIIKAYVVLQSEARGKISEEEILQFCRDNLAHYKVPGIVEFRGELPKTDVGKVSRRELREEAEVS
ncbi:MAG: long-chain fatty acid--CoA ligase [Deltaproteobacteria bacterium]|jgi:long-chain acyl-CoA synthetase|nr:long-chain fatty acid--CoA ligase [Deltaproteobacteria bacterium]